MLRPRSLVLVPAIFAVACAAPAPERDAVDPSSGPGDTEHPATPAEGGAGAGVLASPTPVASPRAVVELSPAEARPCEQMCGRTGDCLRERGDDSADASSIELACLDLCVNADDSSSAGASFRACGQRETCGAVIECASTNWAAADATRKTAPSRARVIAAVDSCEEFCLGVYSCVHFDKTIDYVRNDDIELRRVAQPCLEGCGQSTSTDEGEYLRYIECVHQPDCAQMWDCWERAGSG